MKKDIHPKYNKDVTVTCACGNNFVTGSTKNEISTDLCSVCHPFYTGKQKLVDTARRVEKFQAKMDAQKEVAEARKGKKAKTAARAGSKSKKSTTEK